MSVRSFNDGEDSATVNITESVSNFVSAFLLIISGMVLLIQVFLTELVTGLIAAKEPM